MVHPRARTMRVIFRRAHMTWMWHPRHTTWYGRYRSDERLVWCLRGSAAYRHRLQACAALPLTPRKQRSLGGRPLLGDQGQHVVGRHRLAILVGHVRVPAHFTVPGVLARGYLLAGQRHGQLVAWVDRREEAQVLQAVVGQHRTG